MRVTKSDGECSGADEKVSSEVVSLAVNVKCRLQLQAAAKAPVCALFTNCWKSEWGYCVIALKLMLVSFKRRCPPTVRAYIIIHHLNTPFPYQFNRKRNIVLTVIWGDL